MSVLLEFAMSPFDQGESLSRFVSRSLEIIDQSGIPYVLTPMGTVLEGEWDEVMGFVKQCFDRMSEDCSRISVTAKIDYRAGRTGGLKSKIQTVERQVGRRLPTG
jgi:uncharacterized protein (TIGR00106 family)